MYKWSDFNIYIDEESFESSENNLKLECPKCHSRKKNKNLFTLNVDKTEQSWFCLHCAFAGDLLHGNKILPTENHFEPWAFNPFLKNFNFTDNLSNLVLENFLKKKISKETLAHFKISQNKIYFPDTEDYAMCLVYPYFQEEKLVNLVYFGKTRHAEFGGLETCFNYDNINTDHTYITLDELEVFSLYECGINNAISLFGGHSLDNIPIEKAQSKLLDFLSNIETRLNDVKKITLSLPNNERGNVIKEELLRRLGKERCWVVQPPENNYSWNDVLIDYGKNKLISLLDTAKPIPVRGIFDVDDIEDKLDELYYKGLRKGFSTGFDTVDQYYTIVPGQWTVMTGIPGHGKSNFLDAIMVNLAKNDDWRFGIFSPENQPIQRHFAGIMEKYFEAPFDLGKPGRITEEQKEDGKKWLKRHFSVILPHEDDSWSIDGVLELAKVLVYRKGIKGLVIDPWNELDHSRPGNQTETEYVSAVLTKIRQFARTYDVHVWLVAHPAKLYKDKDGKYPVPTPYDISGSAHYRNKADNAVTVWRNVGHEDQTVADIHIQKVRFKEVGKVGLCSLRYDNLSGAFVDDIDQSKRKKSLEDGIVLPTEQLRRSLF
jgi:twinkle protein